MNIRLRVPEILQITPDKSKQKGALPKPGAHLVRFRVSNLRLEFKADGELNLPFAEEEAIRAARRAERRIKSRIDAPVRGRAGLRDHVHAVVDSRDLCAIEDIETFCNHFEVRFFRHLEAAREPQVNVLNRRLMEKVIRQVGEPQ